MLIVLRPLLISRAPYENSQHWPQLLPELLSCQFLFICTPCSFCLRVENCGTHRILVFFDLFLGGDGQGFSHIRPVDWCGQCISGHPVFFNRRSLLELGDSLFPLVNPEIILHALAICLHRCEWEPLIHTSRFLCL